MFCSEKITQDLVNEMADKNWKIRKEALEKLEAILKEAPFVAPNLGLLPEALKLRLNDNNKILVRVTYYCLFKDEPFLNCHMSTLYNVHSFSTFFVLFKAYFSLKTKLRTFILNIMHVSH